MNTLQRLQERVSVSSLREPAPDSAILREVFKAAIRAADHGMLQPRRFLVITGDGLQHLSRVFVGAVTKANPTISPAALEKCKNMPRRAPMIIVAIARCQPHPKISRQEQIIACGAAVQNILNAFFALGFGAIWRSGEMTQDTYVKNELGLAEGEEIIGFVYVGTPQQPFASPQNVDVNTCFKIWPAE